MINLSVISTENIIALPTNLVEELTKDISKVPEHLSYYIDYERMEDDMEMGGDIFTVETMYNEVHVFNI